MRKAKLLLGVGVLALGFGLSAAEAASPLCDPTPQLACHQGVNVLKLSKGSDRLAWVWKKGEASPVETFGSPISATSYGSASGKARARPRIWS